jgi:hypothetical protein
MFFTMLACATGGSSGALTHVGKPEPRLSDFKRKLFPRKRNASEGFWVRSKAGPSESHRSSNMLVALWTLTMIIWQFFQNEIGCFRATFESATEANPELLHEVTNHNAW